MRELLDMTMTANHIKWDGNNMHSHQSVVQNCLGKKLLRTQQYYHASRQINNDKQNDTKLRVIFILVSGNNYYNHRSAHTNI